MSKVKDLINTHWETVIQHRRWLHAHPELSGAEENTAAYIAQALRDMGLQPVEGVGGHGVVALIEGAAPGKCVGLRADFDALPVEETTGLPFSSVVPGVSHACGHDVHTAVLLGTAYVLNELRDQFNGTVKLVFQPSEEDNIASGAKKMIAEGVLEDPKVDAMLGQHVWPEAEVGKILVRNGSMTAASDRFYITIRGKMSHGSAPENGVDAIVIAAEVVSLLQTIVSRCISPLDSAVITIGEIKGGSRYNIIADEVVMVGTCRNLNPAIRDIMPQRIETIVRGVTESMGGSYQVEYLKGYAPIVNDKEMFALVRDTATEVLGADCVEIPERPMLGSEDFSFYCQEVPGCYYWLGCRDAESPFYPLHHGSMTPSEDAIAVGMEVMAGAVLKFLETNA